MSETHGEVQAVQPIPASIVKALCSVQATLAAVAKSDMNKHGGYKFASTDDIYASVTRKLGEVGLLIMPIELEPTRDEQSKVDTFDQQGNKTGEKTITKLRFRIGYVLATETDTWFDPRSARTLIILHTGPQTFGAAEAFCQKVYLRHTLKIPTGEQDLDVMPQADTEEDQVALAGNGRAKRKSSAEGKRDGSVKKFNEMLQAVQSAGNADLLQQVRTLWAEEWAILPRAWAETLNEEYETRMDSFVEAA
jgi:hypothetical protein